MTGILQKASEVHALGCRISIDAVEYHVNISFKYVFNKGVPVLRHTVDGLKEIDDDPDIQIRPNPVYIRQIAHGLLFIMDCRKKPVLCRMRLQPYPVIQGKLHQDIVLLPKRIPKKVDGLI